MNTSNSDDSNGASPQGKQILTRFLPAPDSDDSEASCFFELVDDPERYNSIAGKHASDVVIRRAALRELLGVTKKNEIVYQYPEGRKFKGLKNGRRSFWWQKTADAPATLWALSEIEYADDIFITEGESDALQLSSDLLVSARHQNVLHAVVALANATAVQNLDAAKFKLKNVWLVMDQDSAGVTARTSLIERLKPVAREIHFLEWDVSKYGKDWCELVDHDESYAFELLDEGWKKSEVNRAIDFSEVVYREPEFDLLVIEEREPLVGDWFCESDLGFIFGRRGLGKSWLAAHLARALTSGTPFGPWPVHKKINVLYLDGEMAMEDYRERMQFLREGPANPALHHLSHQTVFDKFQKAICLSDATQQKGLLEYCVNAQIKALVLDNLGCLFPNVSENDADAWRDMVEHWLLEFRRRKIAVILIAHSGRNVRTMRGTSKREDHAFWSIRLDVPTSKLEAEEGARFITRFDKNRNASVDPFTYDWSFVTANERTIVTFKEADSMLAVVDWVRDGLTSCSDIAEEMGVSKGYVSKLATRAMEQGLLKKKGRGYELGEWAKG